MNTLDERVQSFRAWLSETKAYGPYLILTVVFWAVVPAFAKLGNLNGIQKTFWINWFAVMSMLVLIPLVKRNRKRKSYPKMKPLDLAKISLLGLTWPFLFSISYFEAIYQGSPALTTIIGRTSILIYVPILTFMLRIKGSLSKRDVILIGVTVIAVLISLSGGVNWLEVTRPSLFLAVIAAVCTGIYTAFSEKWEGKYDPLMVIFNLEVITSVLATILVLADQEFVIPTGKTLVYLLFIGIFANGVAFWLQLQGFQITVRMASSHKAVFLVFQSGVVTLAQVLVLALSGAEKITQQLWIGTSVLFFGLVWHRLGKVQTGS